MDTQEAAKQAIAKNLVDFRKQKGYLQLDVAQKLNYTDKAVSKWERGESLPDVLVLMQLAQLYGVTLDALVAPEGAMAAPSEPQNHIANPRIRTFVPILSAGIVWLVATVVFVFLTLFNVNKAWLAFIAAVPGTFIVLLVFNALWGSRIRSCIIISLLIWSLSALVYLLIPLEKSWLLFIIPIPLQVMTVEWYIMKSKKKTQ